MIDDRLLDRAIEVASQSEGSKKVGCLLLDKRGRVVAEACNQPGKSHPLQARYAQQAGKPKNIYLHAELAALVKNRADNVHTLVVVRINRKGYLRMAKPCSICSRAIENEGIEEIYYSTDKGMEVLDKNDD